MRSSTLHKFLIGSAVCFILDACHPAPQPATVLDFDYGRFILLNGKINDSIEGNFVFDTGCYGLILDSTFNARAGLHYLADGSKGICKSPDYPTINFEGLRYEPEYFRINDVKRLSGRKVDGIIGWDFFRGKIVEIDYDLGKMIVHDSLDLPSTEGYEQIPLRIENFRMYVKANVKISNQFSVIGDYLFDTGCGTSIIFGTPISKSFQLDTVAGTMFTRLVRQATLYGPAVMKTKQAQFFRVGSQTVKYPQFDYTTTDSSVISSPDFIGIIGTLVLEKFKIIIDFGAHQLYLKPTEKLKEPMSSLGIGIGMIDRTDICEGWQVNWMLDDVKEIHLGDTVLAINGENMSTIDLKKLKALSTQKENELILKIKRGNQTQNIPLVVRDYFKLKNILLR